MRSGGPCLDFNPASEPGTANERIPINSPIHGFSVVFSTSKNRVMPAQLLAESNILLRPDLVSTPEWILVGLCLIALITLVVLHRRHRPGANPGFRWGMIAARVVTGAIFFWALWQVLGRHFLLATSWSLWTWAWIGGFAVEAVAGLYRLERGTVSKATGTGLLLLRIAAVGLLLFILVQPVYARDGERRIDKTIVVLLDDSESMQLTDEHLDLTAKLQLARLFGVSAAANRPGLDEVGAELRRLRDGLAIERTALQGSGTSDDANRSLLTLRTRSLRPTLEAANRDLTAQAKAVETSRDELSQPPLVNSLSEVAKRLHAFADASDMLLSMIPEEPEDGKALEPIRKHLDELLDQMEAFEPQLARQQKDADAAYYASLDDADRGEIESVTKETRAAIAREVLAGGESPLLLDLQEKYHLRFVRFARNSEEINPEEWSAPLPDTPTGTNASVVGLTSTPAEREEIQNRQAAFRQLTDLTSAFEELLGDAPDQSLGGILLLSDGRHNAPVAVEAAARRLGIEGAPICSVVIGGQKAPTDASILNVVKPDSIFLGDKAVIKADLKLDGLRGKTVKVLLMHGDEIIEEEKIKVPDEAFRTSVRFADLPEIEGIRDYSLELLAENGDVIEHDLFPDNNRWAFEIAVSDDRTNVLIVDYSPRYEFRYLRNLFYGRDKSVHLQYVLFHPDKIFGQEDPGVVYASAARKFGDAQATRLPRDRDEWLKFDVIILGDLPPSSVSEETWKDIEYCVNERGALLVVVSGPRYMPHAQEDPTLLNLLPVDFEPNTASLDSAPEPNGFHLRLTAEGRGHIVMQQSTSPSENLQIWASQPVFYWRHPVIGVKDGAEVLAWAEPVQEEETLIEVDSPSGVEQALEALAKKQEEEAKRSLVVVQKYGKGRVAMLNTDRMWRLRYRVGDVYHHRFWGQLVRWGAGESLRSGTKNVRLGTDMLVYTPVDPIQIRAKVVTDDSVPVTDDKLFANIKLDGKLLSRVQLEYNEDSHGIYSAKADPILQPGRYTIEVEGEKAMALLKADDDLEDALVETEFVVVTTRNPVELAELTADPGLLGRIASVTGGRTAPPHLAAGLVPIFGDAQELISDRRDIALWDKWPLLLLLLGLLTAEWVWRRLSGLT